MEKVFLIILLASALIPFQAQAGCEGPLVPCGLSEDSPNTSGINERDPCRICHLFALFRQHLKIYYHLLSPNYSSFNAYYFNTYK